MTFPAPASTYTTYADYDADGRVTQMTILLPDTATYDQLGDVVRLLFRASTLAAMDTQRDRDLASTKVLQHPANENTNYFTYLNERR